MSFRIPNFTSCRRTAQLAPQVAMKAEAKREKPMVQPSPPVPEGMAVQKLHRTRTWILSFLQTLCPDAAIGRPDDAKPRSAYMNSPWRNSEISHTRLLQEQLLARMAHAVLVGFHNAAGFATAVSNGIQRGEVRTLANGRGQVRSDVKLQVDTPDLREPSVPLQSISNGTDFSNVVLPSLPAAALRQRLRALEDLEHLLAKARDAQRRRAAARMERVAKA